MGVSACARAACLSVCLSAEDTPSKKPAAAQPEKAKKGPKPPKRSGGSSASGGFLSGTWRPLPKDVAIVGLVLVFAGLGCVETAGGVAWQGLGYSFGAHPAGLPAPPPPSRMSLRCQV